MRLLLFILGIGVGIVITGNRAEAQNYPWCAIYSGTGGENCGFTTLEQCMETARGLGSLCQLRMHSTCLHPDHIRRTGGKGAIRIKAPAASQFAATLG